MSLRTVYLVARAAAYLLTLPGVYLYLVHRHDADATLMGWGLRLIMAGFIFFFVSYGLRLWIALQRKGARADRFRGALKDPDPLKPAPKGSDDDRPSAE